MIEELLNLLSSGDLPSDELAQAAAAVKAAPEDPELDWLADPQQATAFAIMDVLSNFIAEGDKIDEVHELLDQFFQEPLPPFPHDDASIRKDVGHYFRWLDRVLAARNQAAGGYALVNLDPGLDDNLHVLIVNRPDLPRILELAQELGLRITSLNGSSASR